MIFSYQAQNHQGEFLSGELDAGSSKEALRLLSTRGLTVTRLAESSSVTNESARKATPQDVSLSLREMATLLTSGVSIADTLEAQSNNRYPQDLKERYSNMADEIRRGAGFSQAFAASEFSLPDYFLQLCRAGELSGRLGESLIQGVEQYEYDLKAREDLRSALFYPALLVGAGILAILLIFVFVVPRFAPLVERVEDLPLLSKIVLHGGIWFNDNTGLLLIAVTGLAGLIALALKNEQLKRGVREFAFGLPVLGSWLHEADVAIWTSQMAALLSAKVGLLDALQLSAESVRSNKRKSLLAEAEKEIRAGTSLADALEKTASLTGTGYNLIRSGEKSGRLPEMMRALSKLYDEAATTRMQRALTLLEPVAILLVGAVIGLMILGVILAITSANELIN